MATTKQEAAKAIRRQGYEVDSSEVLELMNAWTQIFIVPIGDAMIVYTPAYAFHENKGVQLVKF